MTIKFPSTEVPGKPETVVALVEVIKRSNALKLKNVISDCSHCLASAPHHDHSPSSTIDSSTI
ncbi:hypothetical protein K443DRAFT_682412 [Laccaria amethystina LaAM-08-1]|uniref:Uncharacterized protein n=1 Tax=Laccaria amethystina LaAM-08-1 TaxID=1095629 RepID=A0A0C9XEY7_9AGAR|nr:hypothetical protein K443DRAFT_682412 [Laccaria amethystina LaAM-08-1]